MEQNFWRKCIVCKKEIGFSTKYYKCSINSCDKKRSHAQFCTVECWDVHRSIMNHKSAGADEYHSPNKEQWLTEQANGPRVRMVSTKAIQSNVENKNNPSNVNTDEILIVVSKLKAYIKEASGLNTSADVTPELSDIIRDVCNDAIRRAQQSERKTVMARDFKK